MVDARESGASVSTAPRVRINAVALDRLARELLPELKALSVPLEEGLFAAYEFLRSGETHGFDAAFQRARERPAARSMFFDEASRSLPEMVAAMRDRGTQARYVLGTPPDQLKLRSSLTRGWYALPADSKQLSPPPPGVKGDWGRMVSDSLLRRSIDGLAAGECLLVFPPSNDPMVVAKTDGGDKVVLAGDRRMGGAAALALYEYKAVVVAGRRGLDAENRISMSLSLPGGSRWAMVLAPFTRLAVGQ
ncbi:hypothetical protein CDN99_15910 [Roseateles aquatilis]|uniref:Uncharacterized protein n=2 Tax=Roseateles aquatilis TaxID=431061 RepID=A0A246J741_9BURK|nr:hypothetical protein CDN99_15910 [Roseateles aquatilis]